VALKLPPTAIAAPSFPLFIVTFAGWMTAATVWIVNAMSHHALWEKENRLAYPPIAAVIVALAARWVGSSVDLRMLLRRGLAVHALAPIPPILLLVAARSSDPGASGHGGVFLMLVFGIPFAEVPSLGIGLLATLTSYGVMRAIRGPASRKGDPGAGEPRR
jgi:hypothetical protein